MTVDDLKFYLIKMPESQNLKLLKNFSIFYLLRKGQWTTETTLDNVDVGGHLLVVDGLVVEAREGHAGLDGGAAAQRARQFRAQHISVSKSLFKSYYFLSKKKAKK